MQTLVYVLDTFILPDGAEAGVAHHGRTVVHIDVDCFYAQVEMIRNPALRDQPLGILFNIVLINTPLCLFFQTWIEIF